MCQENVVPGAGACTCCSSLCTALRGAAFGAAQQGNLHCGFGDTVLEEVFVEKTGLVNVWKMLTHTFA